MTLFWATLLFCALLGGCGGLLIWNGAPVQANRIQWMRSKPVALALFGTASIWFLWEIWHLGEADFRSLRYILLAVFGVSCVGAFFYVRDLLAARGAAALFLMLADALLDAAYMHYEIPQRLPFVASVFALIVVSIMVGAQPWRLRDFTTWLFAKPNGPKRFGYGLAVWASILLVLALTY